VGEVSPATEMTCLDIVRAVVVWLNESTTEDAVDAKNLLELSICKPKETAVGVKFG